MNDKETARWVLLSCLQQLEPMTAPVPSRFLTQPQHTRLRKAIKELRAIEGEMYALRETSS